MATPRVYIKVNPTASFQASMKKRSRDEARKASKGIRSVLEAVLKRALELVPEETGALAATGRIEMANNAYKGKVVFGDASVDYGGFVHRKKEELGYEPTHLRKPTAKAEFLTIALSDTATKVGRIYRKAGA